MKINCLAAGLAALSITAFAVPASALTLGAKFCSLTDVSPAASACGGWYVGNLNNSSPVDKNDQAAALNALLGVSSYSGSTLTWLESLPSLSGNSANFVLPLYGKTVVSFHVGAAKGAATGVGYSATAFYAFDAGNTLGGLDIIGFNRAGLSNARLYSTQKYITSAIPEPATWAMMIAGFGLAGASLRRRKSVRAIA